eukprot:1568633-Rhodomonas_salina.1
MEAEYQHARKFPQSSARTWAELRGLDAGEAAKRLRERTDGPWWAPHSGAAATASGGPPAANLKHGPGPGRGEARAHWEAVPRSWSPAGERGREGAGAGQGEAQARAAGQVASVLELELAHSHHAQPRLLLDPRRSDSQPHHDASVGVSESMQPEPASSVLECAARSGNLSGLKARRDAD